MSTNNPVFPFVKIPYQDITIYRNSSLDLVFSISEVIFGSLTPPDFETSTVEFDIRSWHTRLIVNGSTMKDSSVSGQVTITDAIHGKGIFHLKPTDTSLIEDSIVYRGELYNTLTIVDILPFVYGRFRLMYPDF